MRAALDTVDSADSLGQWISAVKVDDGSWQMPYARLSSEASDLLRTFDELGLSIPFDWPSWDRGREVAKDPAFEVAASPAEAAMLIVALSRQDRFSEGVLLRGFGTGIIQRAIRRLLDVASPD